MKSLTISIYDIVPSGPCSEHLKDVALLDIGNILRSKLSEDEKIKRLEVAYLNLIEVLASISENLT